MPCRSIQQSLDFPLTHNQTLTANQLMILLILTRMSTTKTNYLMSVLMSVMQKMKLNEQTGFLDGKVVLIFNRPVLNFLVK